MYDQTRMSGSISVEHYSNQNKSEAAVAIDHDLRNQKRQTCQGAPANFVLSFILNFSFYYAFLRFPGN